MIERPFDVRINDPHLARLWLRDGEDLLNGIMTAPAWAKPVAGRLKLSLPVRLQRILDACLEAAIKDSRNAQGVLAVCLIRQADGPPRQSGQARTRH